MLETLHSEELPYIIASILNSRDWYVNAENGHFDWQKSIENLAQKISSIAPIATKRLQEIIETSFDENALSETADEKKFLDQLLELDPNLIIWTEGDLRWQEKKKEQTGIAQSVKNVFYHPYKLDILENIIEQINQEEKSCLLVIIDDKDANLATIKTLRKKFKNIKIFGYQFDLESKRKNPDACLIFLRRKAKKGKLRIISDMDRVQVDTRKTFDKIVAKKIAKEITSPSR